MNDIEGNPEHIGNDLNSGKHNDNKHIENLLLHIATLFAKHLRTHQEEPNE